MRTGYYFTKYLSICHVKLLIYKVKTHRLNSHTNKFYLFKNQAGRTHQNAFASKSFDR